VADADRVFFLMWVVRLGSWDRWREFGVLLGRCWSCMDWLGGCVLGMVWLAMADDMMI
jgi:hypothetical protein